MIFSNQEIICFRALFAGKVVKDWVIQSDDVMFRENTIKC